MNTSSRLLGQLYGLLLKSGKVTDYKIEFTTHKPIEANHYIKILKKLLNIKPSELVYYLEDVQYGKVNSAITKFKLLIKELDNYNLYIFQQPDKHDPKLTIIYYDEKTTKALLLMFRSLRLLQYSKEFGLGFIDSIISSGEIKEDKIIINNGRHTPYFIELLEILNINHEELNNHTIIPKTELNNLMFNISKNKLVNTQIF